MVPRMLLLPATFAAEIGSHVSQHGTAYDSAAENMGEGAVAFSSHMTEHGDTYASAAGSVGTLSSTVKASLMEGGQAFQTMQAGQQLIEKATTAVGQIKYSAMTMAGSDAMQAGAQVKMALELTKISDAAQKAAHAAGRSTQIMDQTLLLKQCKQMEDVAMGAFSKAKEENALCVYVCVGDSFLASVLNELVESRDSWSPIELKAFESLSGCCWFHREDSLLLLLTGAN